MVFPAPSEIVRMLGANDRAKVLPIRRDDPEAARTREIQIAPQVDLHPVRSVFAGLARCVKKDLAIGKRAVGMNVIAQDDSAFFIQLSTYRCFSSGENAKPFGPVKSLLTSFSSPLSKQKTPLYGNSLRGSPKNFGRGRRQTP